MGGKERKEKIEQNKSKWKEKRKGKKSKVRKCKSERKIRGKVEIILKLGGKKNKENKEDE